MQNINYAFLLSRPYGARGLKFLDVHTNTTVKAVAPVWGAWIEIYRGKSEKYGAVGRARMGRVD